MKSLILKHSILFGLVLTGVAHATCLSDYHEAKQACSIDLESIGNLYGKSGSFSDRIDAAERERDQVGATYHSCMIKFSACNQSCRALGKEGLPSQVAQARQQCVQENSALHTDLKRLDGVRGNAQAQVEGLGKQMKAVQAGDMHPGARMVVPMAESGDAQFGVIETYTYDSETKGYERGNILGVHIPIEW